MASFYLYDVGLELVECIFVCHGGHRKWVGIFRGCHSPKTKSCVDRKYRWPKGEWHPFVDRIMEVDLPLGWKPLNLEHYDGTTNLDKHLDVFLSLDNLYTNDDMILCRVFPTPLKE